MLAEAIVILIIGLIAAGLTWAGFWTGKDAASRQAQATIATLRQTCKSLEHQRDDARAELNQLRRALRASKPMNVEAPEWLR